MGYHIAEDTYKYTKNILLTYDLTKLGPRQKTGLVKSLRTGVIKGYSVPTHIAQSIIEKFDAPYIHKNNWNIRWKNIEAEHFDGLTAAAVVSKMDYAQQDERPYYSKHTNYSDIESKKSEGSSSSFSPSGIKQLAKVKLPMPKELIELADRIESNQLTELTVDLTQRKYIPELVL